MQSQHDPNQLEQLDTKEFLRSPRKEKRSGISEYLTSSDKVKQRPKNEFEHAAFVLEDESQLIQDFSQIVDKQIMLSNIKDPELMHLYQVDIFWLVQMFSMALRDEKYKHFFLTQYYTWKNQLKITRAMGGGERASQMAVVANYAPKESMHGYELNQNNPEDKKESNFFSRIFKRKKRE